MRLFCIAVILSPITVLAADQKLPSLTEVLQATNHESPIMRAGAAFTLGHMKSWEASEALLKLKNSDSNMLIRDAAVEAYDRMHRAEGAEAARANLVEPIDLLEVPVGDTNRCV